MKFPGLIWTSAEHQLALCERLVWKDISYLSKDSGVNKRFKKALIGYITSNTIDVVVKSNQEKKEKNQKLSNYK